MKERKREQSLKIAEVYADETGLIFRLPHNKTGNLIGEGKNYKERIMVLLACHANLIDKTLSISDRKSENSNQSNNLQKATHKTFSQEKHMSYTSHHNWLFIGIKYQTVTHTKVLLSVDQCTAHPHDTSYLKDVQVLQPFELYQHSPTT